MVALWEGLETRSIFQSIIALLLWSCPASATTYTYTGLPLVGLFTPGTIPGLTGSVTFDFDTTNFTGTLSLVGGDTANLFAHQNDNPLSSDSFDFPASNPPPAFAQFIRQLNGQFTLTNGAITNWMFFGDDVATSLCPAGPGCVGHGAATLPYEDSYGGLSFQFNNSGGGTWTEVAAVPEPSTWAMLLIGFAAIGFAGYRRRRDQYTLISSAVM